MSKGPSINGSLKISKNGWWRHLWMTPNVEEFRWVIPSSIKPLLLWIVIWVYFCLGSEFLPASARLCSFFCAKIDFDGFSICLALLWNLKDILRKHGKLPSIYLSYFWNTIVYQTTILKNWIFILTNFCVFVNIW